MRKIVDKYFVLNKLDKQNLKAFCVYGKNGKEVVYVTKNNEAYAFGSNSRGSLGIGIKGKKVFEPKIIEDLEVSEIVELACGSCHVIAITQTGKVFSWGSNHYGQLGIGTTINNYKPNIIKDLNGKGVKNACCGEYHTLVLTLTGEIYAWGYNKDGQIGNGTKVNQISPTKLDGFNNARIVSIACGAAHSMALSRSMDVFSWGYNKFGQLGIGNNDTKCVPTRVNIMNNVIVTKVICGAYHSLLLSTDGLIYSFGCNDFKQLGINSNKSQNVPIKLETTSKFKDIAASIYNNISVGQSTNGHCYIWGECNGELIAVPKETRLRSMHAVFATFSDPKITYKPIFIEFDESISNPSVERSMSTHLSNGGNDVNGNGIIDDIMDLKSRKEELFQSYLWSTAYELEMQPTKHRELYDYLYKCLKDSREYEIERVDFSEELTLERFHMFRLMYENCYYSSLNGGIFMQNGRFRNEFEAPEKIGKGSFGDVFCAKNINDEKFYAIKRIQISDKKDFDKKLNELKIWAHLDCDYFVQYKSSWIECFDNNFDSIDLTPISNYSIENTTNDDDYTRSTFMSQSNSNNQNRLALNKRQPMLHIQMDLCELTLTDALKMINKELDQQMNEELTPIGYWISCELFTEILRGVDYLHNQNPPIIHRDLKPSNLLITNGDRGQFVKIADFGLATAHNFADESHTQGSGTLKYMAPEVQKGKHYDTKADIYSLGVILQDLFNSDIDIDKSSIFDKYKDNSMFCTKHQKLIVLIDELLSRRKELRPSCDLLIKERQSWAITVNNIINDEMYQKIVESEQPKIEKITDNFHAYFIQKKITLAEKIKL